MADRNILYRIRAAIQGGKVAVANEIELEGTFAGVVSGVADIESALQRLDGTGIGSSIFTFSGNYSAQSSNMSEWFGNRQQTRIRCIDNGGILPVTFTLPGSTALEAAFDVLVAAGLPETIRFVIEYTGPSTTFLRVVPRSSPSPQIGGTTAIIVRTNIAATVEVTRTSGIISDYVFQSIGGIGDVSAGTLDSLKLINPQTENWDASTNGVLPSQVVKGNAYKVVNAPADGSGRFGEVMENDDWVVWEGETFTSWSAEPHAWFVLPAHEVRRISALEDDFLTTIQQSLEGARNSVVRGEDYAVSAGEIRLKFYNTPGDYSAADLNTTGDIDAYADPADQTGYLAIRLTGLQSALASVLPTLYVYADDGNGNFTRLGNLNSDFRHLGDFTTESDYISLNTIHYAANSTLRVYIGRILERYNTPSLDISEENLSDEVQLKLNREDAGGATDRQRIDTLESKVATLFPLSPDVHDLNDFASIYDPDRTVEAVTITSGYSRMIDYRDDATRYEGTGIGYDNTGTNVVRYTGLEDDLHRCFGFKVTAPSNKVLMWIFDGAEQIPFIDMNAAGNFRVNNYVHSRNEGDVVTNEVHFLSRSAGVELLNPGETNVSTFIITNFPTGATETSRALDFDIDIVASDGNEIGGHLETIQLPAANEAVGRRTYSNTLTGLGVYAHYGTISYTISYELRVDGANLVVDFKLVSITNGFNVRMESVSTILNYTAAATTTRTDNYLILQDLSGDYTFTGEAELLVAFHPLPDGNSMDIVPVVRESDGTVEQLNDRVTVSPEGGFSQVEIPDDIDFRSFLPDHFMIHRDLAHLVTRTNVQWVYGLALLGQISDRQITQQIDFTTGLKSNGRDVPTIQTGSGVPATTPSQVGDIFIDTVGKAVYIATDTGGSGDWSVVTT